MKGLLESFTHDSQLPAEHVQLDAEYQRERLVDRINPQLQAQLDEIMTLLRAVSRSEAPTDAAALAQLKQMTGRVVVEAAFGLWKTRTLDGLAEQERLRSEWDDR